MVLYLKILLLLILPVVIFCSSVSSRSESVAVNNKNVIHEVAINYRKSALSRRRSSLDSITINGNGNLPISKVGEMKKADDDNESRVFPYKPYLLRNLSKAKETDYFLQNNVPVSPFWFQYRAYIMPRWKGELSGKNLMWRVDVEEDATTTPKFNVRTAEPIVRGFCLDPEDRPYIYFTLDQADSIYNFELKPGLDRDYFISVVVETMKCGNETNDGMTILSIEGDTNETKYECADLDYSFDKFQNVEYLTDGDKQVKIKGLGNWIEAKAQIIASIYYETSHCSNCENNDDHFCCGRTSHPCLLESKSYGNNNSSHKNSKHLHQHQHQTAAVNVETRNGGYRCIPSKDKSGKSLLCNGHPNCGLSCNLDELDDFCPPKDDVGNNDDDPCPMYTCRSDAPDRFFITVLILILFCVFVPFCIFMFFCSRKDLRREFFSSRTGRVGCAWPFEILLCPFSINADSTVPPEDVVRPRTRTAPTTNQQRRGNVGRQGRRGDEFRPRSRQPIQLPLQTISGQDNFSFFDDLPPSYSECCNDKAKYPNPPKSEEDYPSVFQVASATATAQDTNVEQNEAPNATQSLTPMPLHWCTCNCGGEVAGGTT